jgi:hypothetical protein
MESTVVIVPSYTIICDGYEGYARRWEVEMYYIRWRLALALILSHITAGGLFENVLYNWLTWPLRVTCNIQTTSK